MIVGLYSPRPQCGKSTVADYLIEQKGFTRLKMAGSLKEMLAGLLQTVHFSEQDIADCIEGDRKEESIIDDFSGRKLMQTLGTEWGRETLGVDFWLTVFRMRYGEELESDEHFVIDDIRFPNEFEFVTQFGGFMWEIRPNEERDGNISNHKSEGSLEHFPFHVTIINRKDDTTITQLFQKVEKAFDICESQI